MRQTSPMMRQNSFDAEDAPRSTVSSTVFNDDEEVHQFEGKYEGNKPDVDLSKLIKLEIKSTQKVIRLDPKNDQRVPVMVSIKSFDDKKKEPKEGVESVKAPETKNQRPGIDLICVIDVSGSMSGEKIELVKKSMSYLLELLSENDRLSIITFESFAERLCPLVRVTPENIVKLQGYINTLSGRGGTKINAGMELALRTLQEKKFQNNVESIFLLSDGIDGGADKQVETNVNQRIDLLKKSAFSVHTFGYGSDHDPKLMKNIANLRDGNFFYVDKLETLDEAFANCLGGLFSVIAEEINIVIRSRLRGIFADIKIFKAFGDITIYDTKKDQYNVKLSQFLSGISKNFVLEMNIPANKDRVGDLDRNQLLIEAEAVIKPLGKLEPITIAEGLTVTFMNADEEVKELDADPDVMENFLRVKAVEVMKQNMVLIEQRKFEEADANLRRINSSIEKVKGVEKFEKVTNLRNDIMKMQKQC